MPSGVRIDRDAIHRTLWDARNRKDCVKIHQQTFAAYIGISSPHMCRIIAELVADERIKKIAAKKGNIGIYVVRDPDAGKQPTGLSPA